MKKILVILLTLCLSLTFTATAFAGEKETTQDASQPRVMVTDYEVKDGSVTPSKKTTLKVTIKNFSKKKAVSNIKLSILDESGEIKTDKMGTQFVDKIYAGGTYVWEIPLIASKTAQIGEHKLTVNMEYEDKYFTAYSSSDIISVTVKQSVGLDYSGAQLPSKVFQEGTETVNITLMNTGKMDLHNCKIDFDIEGLSCGGTVFVGEIPVGESKVGNANLRVSNTLLGDIKGTVTISYEDTFGKKYKKTTDISTKIAKKTVPKVEETEEKSKYPLWWLFLIVGVAVGGGIGFAIPTAINSKKQRKEDELRL